MCPNSRLNARRVLILMTIFEVAQLCYRLLYIQSLQLQLQVGVNVIRQLHRLQPPYHLDEVVHLR